ncbi:hypothetical protein GQ600_23809 [Phytophthora cactorum]|nr:hypothetical protein GQ600_23809 [Phytophthora cactorum]
MPRSIWLAFRLTCPSSPLTAASETFRSGMLFNLASKIANRISTLVTLSDTRVIRSSHSCAKWLRNRVVLATKLLISSSDLAAGMDGSCDKSTGSSASSSGGGAAGEDDVTSADEVDMGAMSGELKNDPSSQSESEIFLNTFTLPEFIQQQTSRIVLRFTEETDKELMREVIAQKPFAAKYGEATRVGANVADRVSAAIKRASI